MKKLALSLALLASLAGAVLHAGPALAQTQFFAYVSTHGNDANNCALLAPCASFQGALAQTYSGGLITCLDAGPFLSNTQRFIIDRSITIDCEGTHGIFYGLGITIQTGDAASVVVLRGLDITVYPLNQDASQGVWFQSGGALHIDKCVIHNFNGGNSTPTAGIFFPHTQSGTMELYVSDTVVTDNNLQHSVNGAGILISPSLNDTVSKVILNRVEVRNNYMGIKADGNWPNVSGGVINMTVRDSVASGNAINGIVATTNSTGPAIVMTVVNSTSSHNGAGYGVIADGPKSFIKMSRTTVSGNTFGIGASNGGQLLSYGNNEVLWNSTDGNPTGAASPK